MRLKQFILNNLHFMWVLIGGVIVVVLALAIGFSTEKNKKEPVAQDLKERQFIPLNCDSISAFATTKGVETDISGLFSKHYRVGLRPEDNDEWTNAKKELQKLATHYPDMISIEEVDDEISFDLNIIKEQSVKYALFPVPLFIYIHQLPNKGD